MLIIVTSLIAFLYQVYFWIEKENRSKAKNYGEQVANSFFRFYKNLSLFLKLRF